MHTSEPGECFSVIIQDEFMMLIYLICLLGGDSYSEDAANIIHAYLFREKERETIKESSL